MDKVVREICALPERNSFGVAGYFVQEKER